MSVVETPKEQKAGPYDEAGERLCRALDSACAGKSAQEIRQLAEAVGVSEPAALVWQRAGELQAEFERVGVSRLVTAVVAFGRCHVVVNDDSSYVDRRAYGVDAEGLLKRLGKVPGTRPEWPDPDHLEHDERMLRLVLPETLRGNKTRPVPTARGLLAVRRLRNPLCRLFFGEPKHYWTIIHVPTQRSMGNRFVCRHDAISVAEKLYDKIPAGDWLEEDPEKLRAVLEPAAAEWLKKQETRCNEEFPELGYGDENRRMLSSIFRTDTSWPS